jgi:hypothetical protein
LHVLSTPPAFVLSQDQTLRQKKQRKHQTPAENVATTPRRQDGDNQSTE